MKIFYCGKHHPKYKPNTTIQPKREIDDAVFGKQRGYTKLRRDEILNILDKYDCFPDDKKQKIIDSMFQSGVAEYSLSYIKQKIKLFAKEEAKKLPPSKNPKN